ncbi:MAG: hypothetical protein JWO95_417, partial [Verrucomicrobiales bacterium]|nr:hypothetical protein [Verrucomicrobiales bacterium]
MDFLRIKKISEKGFDGLVARAGGTRVCDEASADYLLNEAVIELKLVEEEGFEKTARQAKLAKLFRPTRPNSPIVVIDPRKLTDEDAAQYYEIVLGPIKRHVKKAADQLAQTSLRYTPPKVRVLVILNVGYTALSHQEFKKVTFRCVRSYGEEIDWVICGGIYYYSDAFDNFLIEPFEAIPINVKALFPSYSQLVMQWGKLAEQLAFDMMRTELPDAHSRMPCRDLVFTVNGVRYVKPAPKMPPSSFWPSGVRPRDNSTGITKSPS